MTKLALMHLEGRGTAKDPKQAMYWLQVAAERRDPHAHYLLADAHLMGKHLPHDPKQAYIHLALAQRLKHPATSMDKTERLGRLLKPSERRLADEVINKKTPDEFRRQMESRERASAPLLRPR